MQNAEGDDGYAFIGGHVAFGETTDETLVREFKEEIGADQIGFEYADRLAVQKRLFQNRP